MSAGLSPACSPYDPPPAYGLGKQQDGSSLWEPAAAWETWTKLLSPGFGLAQLYTMANMCVISVLTGFFLCEIFF